MEIQNWQIIPYIRRGYREPYRNPRAYVRSIFQWHNETLNICTMIASLLFGTWATFYAEPVFTGDKLVLYLVY